MIDDKINAILAKTDVDLFLGALAHPQQGQFVITGPQMGGSVLRRIGFCVQVRKDIGAFGSHLVFLRHADGSLCTHENQSFFGMTAAQEAAARECFDALPEEEDYSRGYTIGGEQQETGFIIEKREDNTVRSARGDVRLKLEEAAEDGSKSTTLISFI